MPRKQDNRSRSKHQHWVPRFYLRYFATPDTRNSEQPKVWIFSKHTSDGDETLTNVRNVCGKRYLYSPIGDDGNRNWDLDEKLDGLESTMDKIWPALVEGFVPLDDLQLRKGLALFVAVMHLRNPEVREEVEHIHRQLVSFYEDMPLLPDGTPTVDSIEIDGQTHKVDLKGWHDYRSWGRNEHDRFFAHIVESEAIRIAQILLPKRWSVVCATEDIFITSDRPVAIQHQSRPKVGFGTLDTIITFPLGPKRLLVIDDMHSEPTNQYYPLQESSAGAFNLGIWRNGCRFMVTGRPVAEVLAEILAFGENYSGDDA